MILSGHTNSFYTYTLEEALKGISDAGYRYAELTAVQGRNEFVNPQSDRDSVHRILDEFDLKCVAVSCHLELNDRIEFDYINNLLEWAGEFGIQHVNCALGREPNDHIEGFKRIEELATTASESGVKLNFEVHGQFTPTGVAVQEILRELGKESLGINYDTGNVEFYGGMSYQRDLPSVLEDVNHLHLKDKLGSKGQWAFPALGGGHVDFSRLPDLMGDRIEATPLSVEIEFQGDPWPPLDVVRDAMAVSLRHMERCLGTQDI